MTHYFRPFFCLCLGAALASGTQAQGLRAPGVPSLGSAAARAVQSGSQQADYIVAVVNAEPITRSDLQLRLARVRAQGGQQGAALPAPEELARQVLERLIEEKSQLHFAAENGLKIEDEAVDGAEQNVARQNQMDVPELRRRLTADGLTSERFRAELREQLLLARLREREVEGRVRVSDQEVDQYLRDQKNTTDTSNLEIELAQVLIEVPENASAEQVKALQARAQNVYERAQTTVDFSALIREFSDGIERKTGASMGLRSADRYPTLFVQAALNAEKNTVVGPVRSAAGFHVLKVLDKRLPGLPPTTLIQQHARHILLRAGPQLTQEAAVARLVDFKKRVESKQVDFAVLAKEHSQDGSAKEGGDLGWSSPGQFVAEFEEPLTRLAIGQLSEPIVSRFGVHLIQLLERREMPVPVREQREWVRNVVRERKMDEAYTSWVRDIRGKAFVEFREPPL